MTLTLRRAIRGTMAVAVGRLDLKSANDLRIQGSDALDAADDTLVLDLTEIDFIDSSGLGALIGLHRRALEQKKRLEIVPPMSAAREIFALTRTESYFNLIGRPGELASI
jgi:anti-sigma B factor antagonist